MLDSTYAIVARSHFVCSASPRANDARQRWRDDRQNKQIGVGRRSRCICGAARKTSRDKPSFSEARVGGPFGIVRRHVDGVFNIRLPSGVDAYVFGQKWRDKRRRDRASFASFWCCQGTRSCPWDHLRFRRSLSRRRTRVRDLCRSERLPRKVDGNKVVIVCRVSGRDNRLQLIAGMNCKFAPW